VHVKVYLVESSNTMKKQQERGLYLFFIIILLITLFGSLVFAYSISPGNEVHQYISNQSHFVWIEIPDEVEENINRFSFNHTLDSRGYEIWKICSGSHCWSSMQQKTNRIFINWKLW